MIVANHISPHGFVTSENISFCYHLWYKSYTNTEQSLCRSIFGDDSDDDDNLAALGLSAKPVDQAGKLANQKPAVVEEVDIAFVVLLVFIGFCLVIAVVFKL